MAIAKSAIFGGIKGSIGDLIVYEVGGQMRFRSKTGKYKDQKSPQQVAQRTRMKGIANLYHMLDMQLTIFWKEMGKGTPRNGYNLFMSENIKKLTGKGEIVDFNLFKICSGNLPLPQDINADFSTGKTIKISWSNTDQPASEPTDLLQIAVYTPTRKKGPKIRILEQTQVRRQKSYYEFLIPEQLDTPAYFYLFFKSHYTNEISTSHYIGNI